MNLLARECLTLSSYIIVFLYTFMFFKYNLNLILILNMGCWNSKIPAEIPSEVEIESSANTEASTDTETSNSLSDHEQMVLQTGPQAGFNSIQPNL